MKILASTVSEKTLTQSSLEKTENEQVKGN